MPTLPDFAQASANARVGASNGGGRAPSTAAPKTVVTPVGTTYKVKGSSSQPTKAKLVVLTATGTDPASAVTFQFNPSDYTVERTAKWETKPATGHPKGTGQPQYHGSENQTMTVKIFLDDSEPGKATVLPAVAKLVAMTQPKPAAGKGAPKPPYVAFQWGSVFTFKAFVKKVAAVYTMFHPDGTPTRAECTVTLEEISEEVARQNPTSGTLEIDRTHQVTEGETLASIAYKEYGNPNHWRALAGANGIDDPMRVPLGTSLRVPSPEEAAELV